MARIIRVFLDADNLRVELAKLCERFNISFGEESQGFGKALSELPEKLPAADVRPERYGHWSLISDDDQDEGHYLCSECNMEEFFPDESLLSNYCPSCGAKMDEKDGEDND